MPTTKANINLRDIPSPLKNKFKAVCAENGTTMKDQLIKFMEKVVEKGKLPKG